MIEDIALNQTLSSATQFNVDAFLRLGVIYQSFTIVHTLLIIVHGLGLYFYARTHGFKTVSQILTLIIFLQYTSYILLWTATHRAAQVGSASRFFLFGYGFSILSNMIQTIFYLLLSFGWKFISGSRHELQLDFDSSWWRWNAFSGDKIKSQNTFLLTVAIYCFFFLLGPFCWDLQLSSSVAADSIGHTNFYSIFICILSVVYGLLFVKTWYATYQQTSAFAMPRCRRMFPFILLAGACWFFVSPITYILLHSLGKSPTIVMNAIVVALVSSLVSLLSSCTQAYLFWPTVFNSVFA